MRTMTIDKTSWVHDLESIRKGRLISYKDMAKEIGISYRTLILFMGAEAVISSLPATLRKISRFMKINEKHVKDGNE